jgi:hypothetical protein
VQVIVRLSGGLDSKTVDANATLFTCGLFGTGALGTRLFITISITRYTSTQIVLHHRSLAKVHSQIIVHHTVSLIRSPNGENSSLSF